MKKTFLQYTAESLLEKFNCDLSGVTVVFPNKRASLFFNEYLARAAKRPIWSPSYITISELFRQHSKLTVGDPIKLICDLHKSFVRQTGIDETLDRFYGWGQLLLADFDDIDKNMADADKVFQNLSDYHNFDNIDYLSDEQIKVLHKFFENFDETHNSKLKDKFLKLWSRLRNIYEDYNSQLTNQGIAYEGALYRKVVQDNTTDFGCRCYVFVGFNVLQKVETMLFDHLIKEKKALFYWDFDKYYLNDKSEAGHYVKQYLKRYPNELDYDDDNIYNNFSNKKDITYISVPTENIQARYITKWLRSNNRIEAGRNTAIVLCDESLLQGVIHCLPPEADKVNITIGYPLSQSPVYSFVCKLIKLQTSGYSNNDGRFRLNYVKSLLKHPYANYVSENCTTLLNSINENKISYLYLSQLCIDENFTMLFGMSHEKGTTREFLCELSHWILIVLKHIAKQKVDNAPLFQESVFRTYTIVNRLVNLIESDDLDVDINTYERLLGQIISSSNIPFHGEPAIGVQIMGLLETRNLDFDHILLISCNEGNMPKGVNDSSFIPYSIRKSYGLTVIDNKVAIYAYYFHRLLQRAGDITITYNNSTENGKTGEMSRFMLQMMVEGNHNILYKTLRTGQSNIKRNVDNIEKTDAVYKILCDRFSGDNLLTPTAINKYMRCQLQFYYNYIAGIKEPEENDEDKIDNRIFGNIFHDSVEYIYKRLQINNGEVRKGDIEALLKNKFEIEIIVDKIFAKDLFNAKDNSTFKPQYNGIQLINREVIIKYINQLLEIDMKLAPFTILGVEKEVKKDMSIGNLSIKIGGRIDRLDIIRDNEGERIRVVDYKTGSYLPYPLKGVDEIFDPKKIQNHNDYYLQTFLYSLLVHDSQEYNTEDLPVSPALLYIQHSGVQNYDPTLCFGKEKIVNVASYRNSYMTNLLHVINKIFDKSDMFEPTNDENICSTCPYANMCGI